MPCPIQWHTSSSSQWYLHHHLLCNIGSTGIICPNIKETLCSPFFQLIPSWKEITQHSPSKAFLNKHYNSQAKKVMSALHDLVIFRAKYLKPLKQKQSSKRDRYTEFLSGSLIKSAISRSLSRSTHLTWIATYMVISMRMVLWKLFLQTVNVQYTSFEKK